MASLHGDPLAKGDRLGSGASGAVYACTLAGDDGLAVKEFKETRGADGCAEDELKVLSYVDPSPATCENRS